MKIWLFIGVLVFASGVQRVLGDEQATITSDRLEWLERGARTVFSGNVVLTDGPYVRDQCHVYVEDVVTTDIQAHLTDRF
jgi:hypothetical protein